MKAALEVPGIRSVVRDRLISLHTRVFLERAPEATREDRRDRLDALFDVTIDIYLDALAAGYSEGNAREITHIIANFDFARMHWIEMLEFPPEEIQDHYERYATFFEAHDITPDNPLGEYSPPGGLPPAPEGDIATAEPPAGGYSDDLYIEDETGAVTKG